MTAAWIAVDWGSSNLRAWAIGPDGEVTDEAASDAGAITLAPDAFEPALLALVGGWLGAGRTDVDRLRHGRRPRRLDRGRLCRRPVPADAGGFRPPARRATRGSRSASCRACARTSRPT